MNTARSLLLCVLLLYGIFPQGNKLLADENHADITAEDTFRAMNDTRFLVSDSSGNIYMKYLLSVNSVRIYPKLAKWDGQELYIFSEDDGLKYGVIRNIVPDHNEGVWMATDEGLLYYNDGETQQYKLPQPENPGVEGYRRIVEDNRRLYPMIKDREGNIWAIVDRYDDGWGQELYFDKSRWIKAKDRDEYRELWKFSDGQWTEIDFDFSGVFPHSQTKTSLSYNGELVITTRPFFEDKIPELADYLYYTVTPSGKIDKKSDFFRDFTGGNGIESGVRLVNSHPLNGKMLFSYRDADNFRYLGFSIWNPEEDVWDHFGHPGYDGAEYNEIPFAGIPFRNNQLDVVVPHMDGGIWLGMSNDRFGDSHEEPGGGLVWFFYAGNCTELNEHKRFSGEDTNIVRPVRFGNGEKVPSGTSNDVRLRNISGIGFDKNGDLWVGTERHGPFTVSKDEFPKAPEIPYSIITGQVNIMFPETAEENVNTDTHLIWKQHEEATQYRVQLANDPLGGEATLDTIVDSNALDVSPFLEESNVYFWRVMPINPCYWGEWSETTWFSTRDTASVSLFQAKGKNTLELGQNHPNPFTEETTIPLTLWEPAHIRLSVKDTRGKNVTVLLDKELPSGQHDVFFPGNNLEPGIYFYRLETETGSMTRKMIMSE